MSENMREKLSNKENEERVCFRVRRHGKDSSYYRDVFAYKFDEDKICIVAIAHVKNNLIQRVNHDFDIRNRFIITVDKDMIVSPNFENDIALYCGGIKTDDLMTQ